MERVIVFNQRLPRALILCSRTSYSLCMFACSSAFDGLLGLILAMQSLSQLSDVSLGGASGRKAPAGKNGWRKNVFKDRSWFVCMCSCACVCVCVYLLFFFIVLCCIVFAAQSEIKRMENVPHCNGDRTQPDLTNELFRYHKCSVHPHKPGFRVWEACYRLQNSLFQSFHHF